jgi:hypothetical protein
MSVACRASRWAALCIAGSAIVSSAPAFAQTEDDDVEAADVDTTMRDGDAAHTISDEARREAASHFLNGVALFEEEDYQGAVVEFEQAFETVPNPTVLYNLAQAHLALRDYVAARATLRQYLEWPGAQLSEERRESVRFQIETLERRIGSIRVEVNIEGARITVDGIERGTSPLEGPLPVATGRHQVVVSAPGYRDVSETASVAGGAEVTLRVVLEEVESRVTVIRAQEPSYAARTAGQVIFGLGVASAIGAGIGLGFALVARDEVETETARVPAKEEAALAARDRLASAALATDVLTGGALVFGALGLVLWIVDDNSGGASDEEDDTSATVAVSGGPRGIIVSGRFH